MAINPNLLIAAPMLQDYIVDKDTGTPLANGIITLWVDTQRYVTYKNWYYQTGTPGAYQYIPLDNPLHLSSVGTIQDPQGNDVIPFFYPYDENDQNTPQAYFITVYSVDENGEPAVLQFTRENFPFMPSGASPTSTVPTLRNYIINNVYWRNVGTLDAKDVTDSILCPSQHEGYTNGDIRFIKSVGGANDDIAFLPMTETLDNDITPEYYLNFQCSGVQSGETVKCIQYPVSLHIKTLQNVLASLVIHAQNVAGASNNYLDLYVYQFTGTGALTQPDPILIQRIVLNNDFQKFVLPFIFPDSQGLSLGNGGDDALFIRVQYPLSSLFEINHTKPQVYLSDNVPDNDFDTYDQINMITSSPRTGDVRTSMNSFYPYGWVPMNGGTIGNANSNATARFNEDTWPLFEMLWNAFSPYTSGTTNLLAQMVNSSGTNVAYGADAITDFNANNAITLTKSMGQVILGTAPPPTLIKTYATTVVASNSGGHLAFTAAFAPAGFNGMPFYVTSTGAIPTGLSANTIYYMANLNGSVFNISTSFANAIAGTVIAWTDAGSGTVSYSAALAGTSEGEYAHTQLVAELATHNHGFGTHQSTAGAGGAADTFLSGQTINNVYSTPGVPIFNTGSSTPFNVTQPGTFYNIYMKL